MKISAWRSENTFGFRVGFPNRRKYFDPTWRSIMVEIDGQDKEFVLTPGFWKSCPEFRSPVIRDWLYRRGLDSWPRGKPPYFELVPLGAAKFRLIA